MKSDIYFSAFLNLCYRERERYMQKQSSDTQKKNEKLDYKRRKEEELKQKQKLVEQKISKMNEVYSRLLECVSWSIILLYPILDCKALNEYFCRVCTVC